MSEEETKKELTPEEKAKALRMLIIFGAIAFALLVIDFASKWLVQAFAGDNPIAVIPNFFYITKSYNTAVAFSWGSSIPIIPRRIINIVISLVMSVLIVFYWIKHNEEFSNWDRACAMLLASGAIGNLIDRAFYWNAITGFDGVIDFLQFYLGGGPEANVTWLNPFADFNFADAYLTVGVVMLIVLFIVDFIKHPEPDDLEVDPRLVEEARRQLEEEQAQGEEEGVSEPSLTETPEEKPEEAAEEESNE